MPGQIFHSNICQNQLDTCKISDFRKLQSIVVNVISLPVMTPNKFSYQVKKEFLTNAGIFDTSFDKTSGSLQHIAWSKKCLEIWLSKGCLLKKN